MKNASTLAALELEVQNRVNRCISSLECALAVWRANRGDSRNLDAKIEKYERVRSVLSSWLAGSLRGKEEKARDRLEDFVMIVREFKSCVRW